ncbi:MAG TPA: peptidylprolyl isomerase [Methyloceanibacter sp.]|jgi:peptidyl-prolyl cis-trans isomerase C
MSCSLHKILADAEPSVVSVNGVVIARVAIAREVQHHPAAKPVAAWQEAARALIIRELLVQRARHVGIVPAPLADSARRRETEEEALIRGLIEQEVITPVPDEETCRRYYAKNRRLFHSRPIYEAAHILFAARKEDAEGYERARRDAASVLAELKRQPERFGELARTYSACPSAAQAGNLGQITDGQTTPEFERVLITLTPGSISQAPVETRYGLHIIRLDRKIDGVELPFELVAARIADYLGESVRRRAVAQYIARLVSDAEVTGVALDGPEAHRVN